MKNSLQGIKAFLPSIHLLVQSLQSDILSLKFQLSTCFINSPKDFVCLVVVEGVVDMVRQELGNITLRILIDQYLNC
jgi:hypothetical protein